MFSKFWQKKPLGVLEENIDGIDFKFKKHYASKRIKISIRANSPILVTLPKRMPFSHAQEFAYSQLVWIKENTKGSSRTQCPIEIKQLRKEAKLYLPQKLNSLATSHGFSYNKVSVKNMRTRWGSCSYFNNINLNINLMKLEDDLIEYVLLHELVHTVVKNHSTKFWTLLEEYLPNVYELRKRLKKSNIG